MINFSEIEEKWRKAWSDSKIFEAEPNDKPAFMVFAAFPYVNTPLHIGHLRTYGTVDMLARYKRMRGFNVLFPMGFHATGTPVLAFAKRVKNKDQDLFDELALFHVPKEEIEKMVDPEYIAEYFIKEAEKGYYKAGLSIDTRRRFVSIEPFFSKFVEWQFGILNKEGLLVQGKHAVGWCPNENNPVGMHDTKHDIEPEIEEEMAIAFKVDGEDAYMLCATYRPETVFGVTNLFVNSKAQYVLCKISGSDKNYYIAKDAVSVLSYQMQISVIKEISGSELLSKFCINPVTGSKVPVFDGFFVKPAVGTGVVMSVPAHAPFDFVALEKLRKSGVQVPEPIKVLKISVGKSFGAEAEAKTKGISTEVPAEAYLQILGLGVDSSEEEIERATKLEYKEEARWGVMIVSGYEGMSEPEARQKVSEALLANGAGVKIYVLANAPVFCRCGAEIVVKVVEDQWFLNYGNEEWKQKVRNHIKSMKLLPEKTRSAFEYTVEWINLRAVARAQGLGTRFPLDRNYIIESLSDSTIYPAFYTVANLLRNVDPEKLKPEFFDYVMLGIGNIDDVAKSTGIDYEIVKKCRESFDYWYRNTSNHSGPDLIPNHLTMYIFNHLAVFSQDYWPKQIVTNGMVLDENGEKMSKSLGNVVPLIDGIEKYGADALRINVVASADLYSDTNFSVASVRGIQERLNFLYDTALNLEELSAAELKQIDYWLYSKLNEKIELATLAMENIEPREAYQHIFFNSVIELKRYFARGGNNSIVVRDFLSAVSLMLQPVAPFIAEELWHMLGNETFASTERWPESKKDLINEKIDTQEELIDKVAEDMKEVIGLVSKKAGKAPRLVKVIVADDWKRELGNALAEYKNIEKVMASADEVASKYNISKESIAKYVSALAKKINEISKVSLLSTDELAALEDARAYLSSYVGCEVEIESESKSKSMRAERAMPMKPSLDVIV